LSDQDFFFEDEEADTTEKTEAKKPAAKNGAASKAAPKAASKPVVKAEPAEKAEQAASGSFFDQSVTMAMASLIAVIALLVGVIGGFLLGGSNTAGEVPASSAVAPAGTTAPQLTPEQMNSGKLPQGHPTVGAGAGAAAGSKAATAGK
jgi:hypothetical protein